MYFSGQGIFVFIACHTYKLKLTFWLSWKKNFFLRRAQCKFYQRGQFQVPWQRSRHFLITVQSHSRERGRNTQKVHQLVPMIGQCAKCRGTPFLAPPAMCLVCTRQSPGDACNFHAHWLSCVFTRLLRRRELNLIFSTNC